MILLKYKLEILVTNHVILTDFILILINNSREENEFPELIVLK